MDKTKYIKPHFEKFILLFHSKCPQYNQAATQEHKSANSKK